MRMRRKGKEKTKDSLKESWIGDGLEKAKMEGFVIFYLPFEAFLFLFSTSPFRRHETVDERLERMQREENEKEVQH